MASAPTSGAVAEPPKLGDLAAARPIASAGTAAWLCAIPCAVVVLVAILFLGPPLGTLIHGGGEHRFLPSYDHLVRPEPTEQGRYLVALSAPLLLSLATATVVRLRLGLSLRAQRIGVVAAQATAVALVAICIARAARGRVRPRSPVRAGRHHVEIPRRGDARVRGGVRAAGDGGPPSRGGAPRRAAHAAPIRDARRFGGRSHRRDRGHRDLAAARGPHGRLDRQRAVDRLRTT